MGRYGVSGKRPTRAALAGRPLLAAVTARLIDLESMVKRVDEQLVPADVLQYLRGAVANLDDAVDLYGEIVAGRERLAEAVIPPPTTS